MKLNQIIVSLSLVIGLTTIVFADPSEGHAKLRGVVSDFFGHPIPGTSVEVTSGKNELVGRTETNSAGEYELHRLFPGQVKVSVSYRGFMRQETIVDLVPNEVRELDFGLEVGKHFDLPPCELDGTVQGPESTPVAGATVMVRNAFNEAIKARLRSDESGRFKANLENPAQYIVQVSKLGLKADVKLVVLPAVLPRQRQKVSFKLLPMELQ